MPILFWLRIAAFPKGRRFLASLIRANLPKKLMVADKLEPH